MTRKGDRKSGICGVRFCGILQYAVPENPLQLAKIMQGSPSLLKSLSACRERARERERREEREREKERERERDGLRLCEVNGEEVQVICSVVQVCTVPELSCMHCLGTIRLLPAGSSSPGSSDQQGRLASVPRQCGSRSQ
jgi:hypothetical protein